jgi:16S rRNA (adenine1518-N6/adenine1519-N6)-dimethyltransferase
MIVTPKKALGQHFLRDLKIADRIVESLSPINADCIIYNTGSLEGLHLPKCNVLEVGPGMGVLTQYLVKKDNINFKAVEIDSEAVEYLQNNIPELDGKIIQGDFLKLNLESVFEGDFFVIGNFPYNISSQIFFKILEYKERVPMVVGMVQKEVAERLSSPPGNKSYGILSVLLQAWYNIDYLFTVSEHCFNPPPKVKSAVIRLTRNSRNTLGCDEALFKKIVKSTFNQRRKTIKNSLKTILNDSATLKESPLFAKRPEQLSVEEFVELTKLVSSL